ncbi:molybdopterin synthase catalytic subunit MoaE [Neptuniibacter caesariensis]|uniref:Molybdopterin synthase catalytic subunit n=1 Tax=Neptuniibacter caesariensis TaxID=207954 RepID=A0A7U8C540_NEPCE|nr:molybdopterin synthase catalytic subunit MoaE [Neptuniibacter caesariensis]EAR60474.1 molybdopterin converting factor, subunit 2 [Oceanospirillum sp. MED92] [Neptuniibacter caesariensis]
MPKTVVLVQTEDFNIGELSERVRAEDATSGAIVTFTGIVRELENTDASLDALYLEHYPGMTEKALEKIADQARQRWELGNIVIAHRVGTLPLNENIVFVGVGSAHRVNAFEAAQFVMDYLKRDAPFWKKEISSQGESWVEQKQSDLDAAEDW